MAFVGIGEVERGVGGGGIFGWIELRLCEVVGWGFWLFGSRLDLWICGCLLKFEVESLNRRKLGLYEISSMTKICGL